MGSPNTPTTSRLSSTRPPLSPRSPKYGSSRHNRSKSSLPQPKILPFPDLPEFAEFRSRDSSRTNSPLPTPSGDRLEVTFDQLIMSRGGSSDGPAYASKQPRRSSGSGHTTPVTAAGPSVSSPLAIASSISRARALTVPIRASGSPTGRSAPSASPTPRRTDDIPSSSPPRPSTSAPAPFRSSLSVTAPSIPPILLSPIASVSAPRPPSPPAKISPSQAYVQSQHVQAQSVLPTGDPSLATEVMPTPSLQKVSEHLHRSFMMGTCADVRLVVKKWGVCYHVHKMILSQTSFFSSLFLGGFSEGTAVPKTPYKGKGKARIDAPPTDEWDGEDVELQFDDPNITRSAFEISLSRLYSPYPSLQFPTSLLPTSTHPLTPTFPYILSDPDYPSVNLSLPPNTHLSTPRLLLSLLATTIYLGHGNLLREVLATILRTVGPMTVVRYLEFAIGDGVGEEEWEGQSEEGAKGLQEVARPLSTQQISPDSESFLAEEDEEDEYEGRSTRPRLSSDSETKVGQQDPAILINDRSFTNGSTSKRPDIDGGQSSFSTIDPSSMPHFYGVVGNKIGEACVCWLARWGTDLFRAEMEVPVPAYRIWAHRGLPARFVRALLSSDYFFVKDEMERYTMTRDVLELRRKGWEDEMEGKGDLSLGGEFENGWEEWEEEEREIQAVFAEGIRYCHMTFNDLSTIASDLDPHTSLPYAPLPVLQAAHWSAADLRARVTAYEKSGDVSTGVDKDELGLTQSTSTIVDALRSRRRPTPRSRVPSPVASWGPSTASHMYTSSSTGVTLDPATPLHSLSQSVWYPVPSDETHRMGASGLLTASFPNLAGVQGIPDFGPDLADVLIPEGTLSSRSTKPPPHGEKNLFGLVNGKANGTEIEEKWVNEGGAFGLSRLGFTPVPAAKDGSWTKAEPFRFSVEFWDVDKLGEKERYYSATHFYAGSLFNCYIQMIKRKEKGVQLGIYLHRQSPNEPFPTPSAPQARGNNTASPLTSTMPIRPVTPAIHGQPLVPSPLIAGSPPTTSSVAFGARPEPQRAGSSSALAADAPYHDMRSVTKAFFSISCASALGTALIRFASGPDSFALSQSWGWKSSALKSEEYLSVPSAVDTKESFDEGVLAWTGDVDTSTAAKGGRCTLRATVVVGVV